MDIPKRKLGDFGERIATDYLKRKGYQILAQNYIPKFSGFQKAEIDIIVKKENIFTFVEVKTLSDGHSFLPQDKVNFEKQRKIVKAAKMYLSEKKLFGKPWQIDVISLIINKESQKVKIWHLENVASES